MHHLVPCPACQRHVRASEPTCPFCSRSLELGTTPPPALPSTRLGRAATFAFGATLLGATSLVACGGESEDDDDPGKGGSAGTSSGGNSGTASGGTATGGVSSGGTASGGTAGYGGGVGPLYGAPPSGGTTGTDAGGTAGTGPSDDGGIQPAYGFPADGGF